MDCRSRGSFGAAGGPDSRASQYPLDYLRGHRPATRLLQRCLRDDTQPRCLRSIGTKIHSMLVECTGLRAGPHDPHLRPLPDFLRGTAHAVLGPAPPRCSNPPRDPQQGWLLLLEQQQGRLQLSQAVWDVERFEQQSALEKSAVRSTFFLGIQQHAYPRRPDPQTALFSQARPKARTRASLSARRRASPIGLGTVLRPNHRNGCVGG